MEDYKKKYEDALERASRMCAMPIDKATMEYVFPELKEDNDERIRKAIIAHMHIVKSVNGVDVSEILAWLEKVKDFDKQLEEAYKNSDEVQYKRGYDDGYLEGIVNAKKELEKQGEMDIEMDIEKPITIGKRRAVSGKLKELIDNKDPKSIEETKKKMLEETKTQKFKVGDWVVYECGEDSATLQIKNIVYGTYEFTDDSTLNVVDEDSLRLWSIKDAKDGDVLQLGKVTAIFKKYIGDGNCKCYCSVYDGEFEIPNTDNSYGCHNAIPATKEQRNNLFKAMTDKGYTFDFEKKVTLRRKNLIKK